MPLDCEDVEDTYGEKKAFEGETGESFVDLDYKSNIELAKTFSKLSMKEDKMYEKDQENLKSLTEDNFTKLENDEEIIPRAPIGGVPVMPENYLNSNYLCNNNNNNDNNSYTVGSKPKRSYVENEVHAVKYTKPTEHSMLQVQCSTLSDFPNHHIEYNHQTSGGIMTINPSPSVASNEEYDSSFSPGESSYGSPAEDVQVVSPVSDYSSMAASPDNNESAFDETHLKDLCEIIKKDLVKEKLEKALSEDLPQSVPQQASLPSSSPPSLYNNSELNDIINLLKSAPTYLTQDNRFDEQPPVTNEQPLNTGSVNLNYVQFIQDQQQQQYRLQYQQQQRQQAQTVTYSNPQHYNLPCQLPNNKYEQQYPPASQIISTVNQLEHSLNYTQSQQPLMSLNYNQQQNQLNIKPTTISNHNFTSQQQIQRMPTSSQQFTFEQQQPQMITATTNQQPRMITATRNKQQPQMITATTNQQQPQMITATTNQQQPQMITATTNQQQPQMITATTNQQHFSLPQHQTTAYNSTSQQQPRMITTSRQQPQMINANKQQPQMITATTNKQQPRMITTNQQQPRMITTNQQQPRMITTNQQQPRMITTNQQPQMITSTTKQQPQMITATTKQPQMITATTNKQQPQMITATAKQQQPQMITATTNKQQPQMITATTNKQQPQMITATTNKQPQMITATTNKQPQMITATTNKQPQMITTSQQQPRMITATTNKQQPRMITATTNKQQPQMITATTNQQQPQMITATTNQQQPQMITATTNKQQPQMITATTSQQQPRMITTNQQQPQMITAITNQQQPQMITATTNQQQLQMITTSQQQPRMITTNQQQPQMITAATNQQQPQMITATTNQQPRMITTNQQQPQMITAATNQQQPQMITATTNQQQPQMITATTNQQYPQMITATTNQQHFSLPQHQTTAYNSIPMATSNQQYTTSSPQQHVITTPAECFIPAMPLTGPQLSPGALNQNIKSTSATSSNKAVLFVAPPSMLLPTTNSQVIYIPQIPMQPTKPVKPSPRTILPKYPPNNSDPNQIDLKRITPIAKGRQQLENQGQGNLWDARCCVAGMKDRDLESMGSDGDNYLHVAVCKTDVYFIEALLERLDRSGKLSMINKQNNLRQTPLYLAVSANQPAMVHKLIRYGANVNLKGMTLGYKTERVERAPIHCAASQGKDYYDTLKELFKSENIDPDILNSNGLSALHCAIIEHGKLVRNQNSYGIKIDNCQNVSLLLRNKANPNLTDRCSGKTPLMYAIESKDYSMVEAILKAVESSKIPELLKAKTFDGRTCMKIADGLRNEFDPHTWQKIYNILSTVN